MVIVVTAVGVRKVVEKWLCENYDLRAGCVT